MTDLTFTKTGATTPVDEHDIVIFYDARKPSTASYFEGANLRTVPSRKAGPELILILELGKNECLTLDQINKVFGPTFPSVGSDAAKGVEWTNVTHGIIIGFEFVDPIDSPTCATEMFINSFDRVGREDTSEFLKRFKHNRPQ
jgi:hypothetical protein